MSDGIPTLPSINIDEWLLLRKIRSDWPKRLVDKYDRRTATAWDKWYDGLMNQRANEEA